MFRKIRSVKLPYLQQGYIYFTCHTYDKQPINIRLKIDTLCDQCGGQYADELKQVMTSGRSVRYVAMDMYVSETTLYQLRKRFFEAWDSNQKSGV